MSLQNNSKITNWMLVDFSADLKHKAKIRSAELNITLREYVEKCIELEIVTINK